MASSMESAASRPSLSSLISLPHCGHSPPARWMFLRDPPILGALQSRLELSWSIVRISPRRLAHSYLPMLPGELSQIATQRESRIIFLSAHWYDSALGKSRQAHGTVKKSHGFLAKDLRERIGYRKVCSRPHEIGSWLKIPGSWPNGQDEAIKKSFVEPLKVLLVDPDPGLWLLYQNGV